MAVQAAQVAQAVQVADLGNLEREIPMDKIFMTDEINELFISGTRLCNMQCPYCLVQKTNDKYTRTDNSTLLSKLDNFIKKFSPCFRKDMRLTLTGGEALWDINHTMQIINLFKDYTQDMVLFTNGELLGDQNRINRVLSACPTMGVTIGFDTEQKSVFRFNDEQINGIKEFAKRRKTFGIYVVEDVERIKYVAENVKAITELLECTPRVEFNVFKTPDLQQPGVLDELREQLRLCNYIAFEQGEADAKQCGTVYVRPDGNMRTCMSQVNRDYTYNKAVEFREKYCSGCESRNWCRNCEVYIALHNGEGYCEYVKTLAEGARNAAKRNK